MVLVDVNSISVAHYRAMLKISGPYRGFFDRSVLARMDGL